MSQTHPSVTVTKLKKRADGSLGPWADLGAQEEKQFVRELQVNGLLGQIADRAAEVYLLVWEGNKIPRGAAINDHVIAWTQNGVVTSDKGQMVGTYERVVEFGGPTGNAQQMLVFVI